MRRRDEGTDDAHVGIAPGGEERSSALYISNIGGNTLEMKI